MNDSTNASLEQLSALADGQLQGDELAEVLGAVGARAELREAWQAYHVVGEVLRTGRYVPGTAAPAFVNRLQERLTAEAGVSLQPQPQPQLHARLRRVEAANEPVFRWKMVAGLASVTAAAAIGWAWVGSGLEGAPAGAQLASLQGPGVAPGSVLAVATGANAPLAQTRVAVGAGASQIMLRDPRLDELLEAHQQTIGASQMPSSFLRNATFEGAAR